MPCTAYRLNGVLCEATDEGAIRCDGRMFPYDVIHPKKKIVINGEEVEVEETKLVRYRQCEKCFAKTPTRELPFGTTIQGKPKRKAIGTKRIIKKSHVLPEQRCLPGCEPDTM